MWDTPRVVSDDRPNCSSCLCVVQARAQHTRKHRCKKGGTWGVSKEAGALSVYARRFVRRSRLRLRLQDRGFCRHRRPKPRTNKGEWRFVVVAEFRACRIQAISPLVTPEWSPPGSRFYVQARNLCTKCGPKPGGHLKTDLERPRSNWTARQAEMLSNSAQEMRFGSRTCSRMARHTWRSGVVIARAAGASYASGRYFSRSRSHCRRATH